MSEGYSLMQTPSWVLALLFLSFSLISLLVEKLFETVEETLQVRKRFGLLNAVSRMKTELMLVGLLSLLITAFGQVLVDQCVEFSWYQNWWMLDQIDGPSCPCCVKQTAYVDACWEASRQCGDFEVELEGDELKLQCDFCNCDNHDPSCVPDMAEILDTSMPQNKTKCLRVSPDLPEEMEANPAEMKKVVNTFCIGSMPSSTTGCGVGKVPLLSLLTQEQLHLFLFISALLHIFASIIVLAFGTLTTLLVWGSWEHPGERWGLWLLVHKAGSRVVHWLHSILPCVRRDPRKQRSAANMPGSIAAKSGELTSSAAPETAALATSSSNSRLDGVMSAAGMCLSSLEEGKGGNASSANLPASNSGPAATGVVPPGRTEQKGSFSSKALDRASSAPGSTAEQQQDGDCHSDGEDGESQMTASTYSNSTEWERRMRTQWQLGDVVVPPEQWFGMKDNPPSSRRLLLFKYWVLELLMSAMRQFSPVPVRHQEYEVVRASFIATHGLRGNFDFIQYIASSMSHDYAKVVGLSIELWLITTFNVLLFGVFGWVMAWGIIVIWCMLIVVNTKLAWIIRTITKGGTANRLDRDLFWFKRPHVMLVLIRGILFASSFVFTGLVFFAWQFGSNCCVFNNSGLRAMAYQPYYVDIILAALMQINIGYVTLPLYSLAIHLSNEIRPNAVLSQYVQYRLVRLALDARERVRQRRSKNHAARANALMLDPVGAVSGASMAAINRTRRHVAAGIKHGVDGLRPKRRVEPNVEASRRESSGLPAVMEEQMAVDATEQHPRRQPSAASDSVVTQQCMGAADVELLAVPEGRAEGVAKEETEELPCGT